MNELRRLNFHHLYYFWMVAREGHLTRTAQELHVSQSALSAQIRQLEDQLGSDLFIREGRTLRLTEMGAVVLEYADSIFSLGNELMATISGGEGLRIQQLRVGAVATLSRNFQENFLRPIMEMDDVRLVLESGSLAELLERLGSHKLDLVLSNQPVSSEGQPPWRCRRIARQTVFLIGQPREKDDPFRFPEDLAAVKLVLPGRSSDIRQQFDVLCEDLGIDVKVYAEVDDMAMLRLMVRDTGGVALVPSVVVQDELRNGTLREYCEVPNIYENFYAISTRRHVQAPLLKRILQQVEANSQQAGPGILPATAPSAHPPGNSDDDPPEDEVEQ